MSRVYNFSAGPSALPEEVLKKAAAELVDYRGLGLSVMEMSHRSKPYQAIIDKAEKDLRELMGIPGNYKVLFLQGGASLQFALVPLNLFTERREADYLVTGEWATRAWKEAKKLGAVNVVASSEDKVFNYIPKLDPARFNPKADYFHVTTNNTIYGTRLGVLPETGAVPLVADMSSNILSEPMDVTRFGLIYAGAQKNIGPAGLAVVIVREDLLARAPESLSTMFKYRTHAEHGSMFNTPPCYAIYMAGLVFDWLKERGGVEAMGRRNHAKAAWLYEALDRSRLFHATVADPADRSIMNVPFRADSEEINEEFIKSADKAGLIQLRGHRTVGGMRASIYNAMPDEGVKALVQFIGDFERKHS